MEKETEEKKYELVQVPTEHRLALRTPEGEILNTEEALVLLLNEVSEMRKVVG